MNRTSLSACLLALPLLSLPALTAAAPELKGNPEELRQFLEPRVDTVQISASAEETAYTDIAKVLLVVTTEEDQLADAIAANAKLREQIADALINAGVEADKINSSEFSTSPQYGWFGKKPSSFKVVNRVQVEIDNGDLLETIAGLVDSSEAISLADTTFSHSAEREFENKVRSKALDEIMEEKAFYEERLGVVLTPLRFMDGTVRPMPARAAAQLEEVMMDSQASYAPTSVKVSRPAPAAVQNFDEVVYRTTVTVVFSVAPAK